MRLLARLIKQSLLQADISVVFLDCDITGLKVEMTVNMFVLLREQMQRQMFNDDFLLSQLAWD